MRERACSPLPTSFSKFLSLWLPRSQVIVSASQAERATGLCYDSILRNQVVIEQEQFEMCCEYCNIKRAHRLELASKERARRSGGSFVRNRLGGYNSDSSTQERVLDRHDRYQTMVAILFLGQS